MNKYSKLVVLAIIMLIFATWFSHNIKSDLPLIFQKDLHAHDESSNSVVAANTTRQFFPPMVRVNPLSVQQGNWMEGPYWQHIPPLFAYVPYVFFKLDGQITIEVKRLAYAFITLLTGLLLIWISYWFLKNLLGAFAALVAAIFWINTPFTHELITGYAFGASDIMLAFTSVLAFGGLLYYLREERSTRQSYSWKTLMWIAFLVALPIMTKNLLGAIPATAFLIMLVWDQRRLSRQFWTGLGSVAGFLAIYYLPLFLSSPAAFKSEILVSFFHTGNYEGWGRPMFWYVMNYLPQRYLFSWTWVFYLGIVFSIWYLVFGKIERQIKILLALSLGWFVLNLIAVSLVASKIPNFIYQSYLLALFAIVLSIVAWFDKWRLEQFDPKILKYILAIALLGAILYTGRSYIGFANMFKAQRAATYNYSTEHEKFYEVGEWMRSYGINTKDLTIVRVSDNDCWFRYYVLFLTGAESKTLLEMNFNPPPGQALQQKYHRIFLVLKKNDALPSGLPAYSKFEVADYEILQFNIDKILPLQAGNIIQSFVQQHQKDIEADIVRIKADKTSCQWLVPDAVLNAP